MWDEPMPAQPEQDIVLERLLAEEEAIEARTRPRRVVTAQPSYRVQVALDQGTLRRMIRSLDESTQEMGRIQDSVLVTRQRPVPNREPEPLPEWATEPLLNALRRQCSMPTGQVIRVSRHHGMDAFAFYIHQGGEQYTSWTVGTLTLNSVQRDLQRNPALGLPLDPPRAPTPTYAVRVGNDEYRFTATNTANMRVSDPVFQAWLDHDADAAVDEFLDEGDEDFYSGDE